jgi:hypothetical protein
MESTDLHFKFAVQCRPLTPTSFVDNHQIVEGRGTVKLGPVLILESPAPIIGPHPPYTPTEVGADIIRADCGAQWVFAIKIFFELPQVCEVSPS